MDEEGPVRSASRPSVVICSDDHVRRECLASSLATDGRVRVISAVGSDEAANVILASPPDAVLLDADVDGPLRLAQGLGELLPGLRIVGFGIVDDARLALGWAKSGVAGIAERRGGIYSIVKATLAALTGEPELSSSITNLLQKALTRDSGRPPEPEVLTAREREIAALVGQGLPVNEIAASLEVPSSTVRAHIHAILDKLRLCRQPMASRRVTGGGRRGEGR